MPRAIQRSRSRPRLRKRRLKPTTDTSVSRAWSERANVRSRGGSAPACEESGGSDGPSWRATSQSATRTSDTETSVCATGP